MAGMSESTKRSTALATNFSTVSSISRCNEVWATLCSESCNWLIKAALNFDRRPCYKPRSTTSVRWLHNLCLAGPNWACFAVCIVRVFTHVTMCFRSRTIFSELSAPQIPHVVEDFRLLCSWPYLGQIFHCCSLQCNLSARKIKGHTFISGKQWTPANMTIRNSVGKRFSRTNEVVQDFSSVRGAIYTADHSVRIG